MRGTEVAILVSNILVERPLYLYAVLLLLLRTLLIAAATSYYVRRSSSCCILLQYVMHTRHCRHAGPPEAERSFEARPAKSEVII